MMGESSIPVDLHNPGEVFGCLGFLEAADALLGGAQGGFDWAEGSEGSFVLRSEGPNSPVEQVLEFITGADLVQFAPRGFDGKVSEALVLSECFPSREAKKASLPCRLKNDYDVLPVGHWADGSRRDDFKQFAGRMSPFNTIIPTLLDSIRNLWSEDKSGLLGSPFEGLRPVGRKSWKLDARAAWNPRSAGYSLNDQAHNLAVSPVVELIGAVGLQHARPASVANHRLGFRYGAWGCLAVPGIARPALGGVDVGLPLKRFEFVQNTAGQGKYKQATFATEVD